VSSSSELFESELEETEEPDSEEEISGNRNLDCFPMDNESRVYFVTVNILASFLKTHFFCFKSNF